MEKQIPYGLRITFLVYFVLAGVFGLVLLLIPAMFGAMLGVPVMGPHTYRLIGAAFIATGAGSWFAYRGKVWERVKIVVQMEIVWTVLGVLAVFYGLLFEGLPAGDWMSVIVLGAFAVAFIFFYSRGR